uniref:Uncharacterized protein n=1 Tax=Rhizophora mucronata TaxID=61149 RepID=A0A2P2QBX1_RHIMU
MKTFYLLSQISLGCILLQYLG